LLAALVCGCAPLAAAKRAGLCAAAVAAVAWLCGYIAVGVLSDGLWRRSQDEEA